MRGEAPPQASPQAPPTPGPELGGALARWLAPTAESRIERIGCARIAERAWWPAADAPADVMAALRGSIASRGIVEPLLLRRRGEDFEVVCGARRLRAARELGQEFVPAIVRELSDREALLVAAWTTLERRRAEGADDDAALHQLVAAGLSASEAMLLSAAPERRPVAAGNRFPAFVLQARPLPAPDNVLRYAPVEPCGIAVLPPLPPGALTAALRVLDNVRPAALLS